MKEEDLRRELTEMLGPRFGAPYVSEDDRRELAEAFRNCGGAFVNVLTHLDEPHRTAYRLAYLLRVAARERHRFASPGERSRPAGRMPAAPGMARTDVAFADAS